MVKNMFENMRSSAFETVYSFLYVSWGGLLFAVLCVL